MNLSALMQLLARGEDNRHQFKRDATTADFCSIQACFGKTRAIKQGLLQNLSNGLIRLA